MSQAPIFDKVSPELNFPREEREILELWKQSRIFQRSLEQRAGQPTFVFYEGPPTANGLPHNGHVLTRVVKDLFPRYKTMRGYKVPRKAGWDTHGLPVEVEVEKELRIHGKAAIEEYGVEPFVRRCIESVFRYTSEWEHITERVGFWVDLKDAYVTYHQSYVESVWWALSQLFQKGLLYQGHKVVWWWAQGGTALSSAEVGLGYKQVDDPSVFVAFPLVEDPTTSLLVWTTTPWTLPSNMYAAVHPDFEYAKVEAEGGKRYVVARELVPALEKKLGGKLAVLETFAGRALAGKEYRPPFDLYASQQRLAKTKDGKELPAYWRVIAADFVLKDASGIVHIAPAFGEDDYGAHKKEVARFADDEKIDLFCAVKPDGTFVPELTRYAGRWVKDCDKEIQKELDGRGLLVHAELYRHDYPFCWRADSNPLIQFARPAWYIRTTALKDMAIADNRAIQWLPEHIKEGRMGDFLANNVDWALSRERYWGTPLNVWVCPAGHQRAPASVKEIESLGGDFSHFRDAKKKDPSLSDHLIVHKPWIDEVRFPCPDCKQPMERVKDVIDCWFDSGCMPFAQWGYPQHGKEKFEESFPADFISEAIDQTRGWFYSLLMISTLVFSEAKQPHPFKTCIVLGHVSDKEGKKESKQKGNYTPPSIILDDVAMDFAVVTRDAAEKAYKGFKLKELFAGHAYIAPEDLDGLDLSDGAKVTLGGPHGKHMDFVLHGQKGLPRRVIVTSDAHHHELSVSPTASPDVKPVEVPRLPPHERVTLRDPSTPAPGADAFRWFFYASNPPWNATRHSLSNVRALQKEFAVKLRNVYSFFTIYANIDGFHPYGEKAKDPTPFAARPELDRWMLGELSKTVVDVTKRLDGYDVYGATQVLTSTVDALSNWWVRRSRERFWRAGWDADKKGAYETLYECLVTIAKLTAPFVPFASERMYQNLVVGPAKQAGAEVPESVHLASYPEDDGARYDARLSAKMAAVRDIVSVGLQVRTQHKLKVRQPLRAAHVVLNDVALMGALREVAPMVKEELNVLDVGFVSYDDAATYGAYSYKPSFRSLGQRGLGKLAQELKKAWAAPTAAQRAELDAVLLHGKGTYAGQELVREDIEAFFETKPGFAAAGDRVGVVVLETTLDDELRELGFLRELLNRIQTMRKEMELEFVDRIHLGIAGGARVAAVMKKHAAEIAREVLAVGDVTGEMPAGATVREVDVDGEKVTIGIARV